MLNIEDNQLITRVGAGTPMGDLIRRYWIPALLSVEVPEVDGPPIRVRLLGEDLVAFRDTEGTVGLVANACPHRGASMFFGRNEETGLRCVYHGWKFDVSGACVDMPSEPAESNFKSKVRIRSYPTEEAGGTIWAYMGRPEEMPPFRDFGFKSMPKESWRSAKQLSYCNYLQAMEGDLDTVHLSYLHRNLNELDMPSDETDRPGFPSPAMAVAARGFDRTPRIDVEETDYGFRYAALRTTRNGHTDVRISHFALPFFTFIPAVPIGNSCRAFVPIDDDHCWRWNVSTSQIEVTGGGPIRRTSGFLGGQPGVNGRGGLPENDYFIDREAQKTQSYTGIANPVDQDLAATESMGTVYDRSAEHLGTSDRAVIRMRELLLSAIEGQTKGSSPRALGESYRILATQRIIATGADWRILGTGQDNDLNAITVKIAT